MSEMKRICRGCLLVNYKNDESRKGVIDYFYEFTCNKEISSAFVDNVQLGLCPYCTTTLIKILDFKKRCLEATHVLKNLLIERKLDLEDFENKCKLNSITRLKTANVFNFDCKQSSGNETNKKSKHKVKNKKNLTQSVASDIRLNASVVFVSEDEKFLNVEALLDVDKIDDKSSIIIPSMDAETAVDKAEEAVDKACSIKSELGDYYSDGFDSEDDKVLTKLESNSKDVAKKMKLKNGHRTKKKQKKRQKIGGELFNEDGKTSVTNDRREEECNVKNEMFNGLDVRIKEEEMMTDDQTLWDEITENEVTTDKDRILQHRTRTIYYRFDESNVQLIKQSAEEIHKELEQSRGSNGYLNAPYKCHPCAKYFMTDISLTLHNQRHSEAAGPMVCEVCTQRYTNQRSLSIHMQTHTDRYKCAYVGPDKTQNTTGENLSLDNEEKNDEQKQQSIEENFAKSDEVCGRVFAARSAAVKHSLKHTGDQMLFHCHLCGKTTNCANTHQKHVRSHTIIKKYACPQCNKEFRNSTTRNLHVMRAHTGVRHFTCPSCPMTFVNKTALVAHSVKHSSNREFYCVECDMYFKSASILKCHLTTSVKHSDPNTFKFQCSLCPRRYPLLYRLRDHIESAHTRRGQSVCDACGAAYHTAAALRRHHRQKHENTPRERKHRCLVCDKAFLTRQTLASHQLTHTGERPFPCQLCGRLFRHKAALWTHNKLVHNKNKITSSNN